MCGIALIVGKGISPKLLEKMVQAMNDGAAHRGPDDEGIASFPGRNEQEPSVAMGHRRLSIIDLTAAGHQPMSCSDGRYWITYNGEIYNYLELRKELTALGIKFHTSTDTEVLLSAYKVWGRDSLARFNGMFAFAIYDSVKRELFIARDRFGVKPLYYWRAKEGYTAFASEIGQIAALPHFSPQLNRERGYDFLNWSLTDHTEETLFLGVKQLQGGHYLHFNVDETAYPRPWYRLNKEKPPLSYGDAIERFHDLFVDAVKLRLRSDVEVGSCLSGGIDSSSIVAVVDRLLERKLQSFSSCSREKEFDERVYIEALVKGKDVEANYLYPDYKELFHDLDALTRHQGEPFASTSIYAQWQIFKSVKKRNVPVMLDGQGADEQLAGYHSFYGYHLLEKLKKRQFLPLAKEIAAIKRGHPHLSPILMLGSRLLPRHLHAPINKILGRATPSPHWLDTKLFDIPLKHPHADSTIRDVAEWSENLLLKSNLPMLLRYEDRNSMAHSIESRTPFLDYRLVEFSLSLPSEYKLEGLWTKKILRESMSPYLPPSIAKRVDKMAFVTPEERWMSQAKEPFEKLLKEAIELSNGLLKRSLLEEFHAIVEKRKPFSFLPWRAISFGRWLKIFDVSV